MNMNPAKLPGIFHFKIDYIHHGPGMKAAVYLDAIMISVVLHKQ
jgi:hypothetical protein